jgi:NNP family nitrate/nitrite transporter-like MFS transporter
MLSIPIFAGALMRFPLGVLAQYIGRKNATLVEMTGIAVALMYGYFVVETFNDLLAMGVLLGLAGASFGVALSLGSGSFPPRTRAGRLVGAATGQAGGPCWQLAQWFGGLRPCRFAAVSVACPRCDGRAHEPSDLAARAFATTSPACSRKTAGPSASSTPSPSAVSSA